MTMDKLVPLTEAKNRLHEIVRQAADDNVVILRHGRPVAVVISPAALEALLDEVEDLKDRCSVLESRLDASDMRVPIEKVRVELGLI
jgi:antitoxin StbD